MKRILIVLLALLTVLSCFAVPTAAETQEATVTEEAKDVGAEEDEIPSSFSLIGTPDLPPICNQGEVGCCASCAITYTQYTNAVSKYIRKYHPEIKFEPATGDLKYLFSPKWTFGFSGSGTAWVYHILMEQGAATMDVSSFYIHPKENRFLVHKPIGAKPFMASAVAWDILDNQMENAMKYRLNGFEQIWVGGNHQLGKVDGKLQLTTTKDGQELLNKIKASLNAGNVVVTGGLSSVWQYSSNLDAQNKPFGKQVSTGTLGKKTDKALIYSRGVMAGGHQLSIVGYDDDIAYEVNGVTLKGAFQVSNSWGTTWMNDGYVWLMYDALNELSEYEELNFEDRTISMDQFCFTDWENDIIEGLPELYVEVEASSTDREHINIYPIMKNKKTSVTSSFNLHMFSYSNYHPDYDELDNGEYFNINGEKNGKEAKGTFAVGYNDLISNEETIGENTYGVRVSPRGGNVTVHALRLKNNRGQVIAEIEMPKDGESLKTPKTYYFDSDVYKIVFEQEGAVEGSSYEAFSAYYCEGNKVPLNIQVAEGYTDANAKVVTDTGKTLSKNADGLFELTVSENAQISYSGIEKAAEEEPSKPEESDDPTPEESVAPESSLEQVESSVVGGEVDTSKVESDTSKGESDSNSGDDEQGSGSVSGIAIGVIIAIVAVVAVVAAVIVVIVVFVVKKRK